MTAILGISAFYHDSAAALVVDGRIVAAAQEERFTRKKHDEAFPRHAVEYCLAEAGLSGRQLDYVGFYEKPLVKFDRLLETFLATAPRGYRAFVHSIPSWLHAKLHVPRAIHGALGDGFGKRIVFAEHHESHAASAFFPSPFDEAAILTLDGVGEWATASFGYGRGNRIELTHEQKFPHSLGMLYSAFTHYCGFRVNSGEYKLMGLAPYGRPKYADLIRERLVDMKPDGSFRLNLEYFEFHRGLKMTSKAFDRLFGGPARQPEAPLRERDSDIAASIQAVAEEIMLAAARHVHEQSGAKHLCLAGGVALNCVGNGRIAREGPFDRVWIQPAAGDAGGALGVALLIWHQLLGNPRHANPNDSQHGSLLGPSFDDAEIEQFLERSGADYVKCATDADLCERVSALLAEGKVVGWFQGRMEFGPRAGARSILGDARSETMQSILNRKVKFRESFRPFAPSVLAEHASEYFELPQGADVPYMTLTAKVQPKQRVASAHESSGVRSLAQRRSTIPAVTHVDDSSRVQTVDARHGVFRRLLERFHEKTGCPVLINTSFNVRGEPIVCTPEDAYRCFHATHIDALALGRCVLVKTAPVVPAAATQAHLRQFALD